MNTKADWIAAKAELDAIEAERSELLKPTNERYCAAMERLEEIEDTCGEFIDRCEGCQTPIFEGEKHYTYEDGPTLCAECAPTYGEMLDDPSGYFTWDENGDEIPMTPEKAKEICDRHISAGGALTDSMAEA